MRAVILGCGTSGGVPRIGNVWGVCDPAEPRNRRRRASIVVEQAGRRVLVDTSPDLREQCLDNGIDSLDAVLYTHDHADHTHGIDDLRGFYILSKRRIPIYADGKTLTTLHRRFPYIFDSVAGYPALVEPNVIDGRFEAAGIEVRPFLQEHGPIVSFGFRFGPLAYSTDLNGLPDESFEALEGIDTWIVDALRPQPHPTHAHLELTLSWIERVRPRRAILTHMTWDMDYQSLRRQLPDGVEPGYDGMVVELVDSK